MTSFKNSKYIIRLPIIVAITLSLGIFIEVLQHFFITFRQGDILDVIANAGGTITGVLLVLNKLAPKYFLLSN